VQYVDCLGEPHRIHGPERVTVEVVHDLRYAGIAEPFERLRVGPPTRLRPAAAAPRPGSRSNPPYCCRPSAPAWAGFRLPASPCPQICSKLCLIKHSFKSFRQGGRRSASCLSIGARRAFAGPHRAGHRGRSRAFARCRHTRDHVFGGWRGKRLRSVGHELRQEVPVAGFRRKSAPHPTSLWDRNFLGRPDRGASAETGCRGGVGMGIRSARPNIAYPSSPVRPLLTHFGPLQAPKIPLFAVPDERSQVSDQQRLSAPHSVNHGVLNRFLPCIRASNRGGESEEVTTVLAADPRDS
jgi:hypothetical protein